MKKIFILLIIVGLVCFMWFWYGLNYVSSFKNDQSFKIEAGDSAGQIADKLKSSGLLNNRFLFLFYARFSGSQTKFVSGEHWLKANSSIKDLVIDLTSTATLSRENKITFLEGWKISDIADYLDTRQLANKKDFLRASDVEAWRVKYDFLQDKKISSLEGFIFPDTYMIFFDASAEDIIAKSLNNFNAKLTTEMKHDLAKQGRSLYDALILASIIEREALYSEDRPIIAGIFLNRLREGIGLQSDATVNYATGKKNPRPTFEDLKIESPYNTYKYRGLPPTPICNPGLASIKASIYPQQTDYYYFLTDEKGKAHFGKTYAEHQQNIAKYLD